MAWCTYAVLIALALVFGVASHEYPTYNYGRTWVKNYPNVMQYIADKEYIQNIQSLIDAYKGEIGSQMVIESNEMMDTQYRTRKRNADLINSLLALPKGMTDAGR